MFLKLSVFYGIKRLHRCHNNLIFDKAELSITYLEIKIFSVLLLTFLIERRERRREGGRRETVSESGREKILCMRKRRPVYRRAFR